VAPALDATVMDAAPDLPAARAHPPAPAQAHSHDHLLSTETDIDDGRPGQAEHPVQSGTDAHVVLLRKPLVLNSQQPAAEDGGASPAFCATSEPNLGREVPAQTDKAARGSPPNNEKTHFCPACGVFDWMPTTGPGPLISSVLPPQPASDAPAQRTASRVVARIRMTLVLLIAGRKLPATGGRWRRCDQRARAIGG
jgi:hypothetical protein